MLGRGTAPGMHWLKEAQSYHCISSPCGQTLALLDISTAVLWSSSSNSHITLSQEHAAWYLRQGNVDRLTMFSLIYLEKHNIHVFAYRAQKREQVLAQKREGSHPRTVVVLPLSQVSRQGRKG